MLAAAVERAQSAWGERLLAAYALGSLAHGGFSELVSDVDLGLVLAGPLTAEDGEHVAGLGKGVDLPLGDRLAVFWGSRAELEGVSAAGRFPPLDRLDLIRYGRLLFGANQRAGLPEPSHRDLVIKGAEAGLGLVRRPANREAFAAPASLLAGGPKPLTKTILFPVRFMYTARTGQIGRNHDAADHFASAEPGARGELAAAALRWRDDPPATGDPTAAALLEAGLVPIYELLLRDHAERMDAYGLPDLAGELRKELASLADSSSPAAVGGG